MALSICAATGAGHGFTKKGVIMKILLIPFIVSILLLTACSPNTTIPDDVIVPADADRDSCSTDDDCICGGIDKATGNCFLGNTAYYKKYVDSSKDCPDFCSGIAGNMVTRCVNSRCMQVFECLTGAECDSGKCENNKCVGTAPAECSSDSDCKRAGCSGELCMSKSARERASICEFKKEYECLEMIDCGCTNGRCAWKTTEEYDVCVEDAKENV